MPDFQVSRYEGAQTGFRCTVAITGGQITPFGSDLGTFPSIQGAKAAAAEKAVHFLLETGRLSRAAVERRKSPTPPKAVLPGHTGLTQAVNEIDVDPASSKSYRQRVNEMAIKLQLHEQPQLKITPSTTASGERVGGGWWDVCVQFNQRDVDQDRRFAGSACEVRNVLGKDKAKEACAERLLRFLNAIEAGRMALD